MNYWTRLAHTQHMAGEIPAPAPNFLEHMPMGSKSTSGPKTSMATIKRIAGGKVDSKKK